MHKTKEILIKNALDLFLKNGFADTSIQEIIDKSKVSKGAFYHYFSSKEDILDTIAGIHVAGIVEIMNDAISREDMNALEKLNLLIINISSFKTENLKRQRALSNAVNEESNLMLNKKIVDRSVELSRESLKILFRQGVDEGIFKTKYDQEFAEFFIQFNVSFQRALFDYDLVDALKTKEGRQRIKRGLMFFEDMLERILGLEPGSLLYSLAIIKDLKL